MKPRRFPIFTYDSPRDIIIKNVVLETAGEITERGFIYISNDENLRGKKAIVLIVDE